MPCACTATLFEPSNARVGGAVTWKLVLVPVALPLVAVIVTLVPVPVIVTVPVQTPLVQPVVPVAVGLILVAPDSESVAELAKVVIVFP